MSVSSCEHPDFSVINFYESTGNLHEKSGVAGNVNNVSRRQDKRSNRESVISSPRPKDQSSFATQYIRLEKQEASDNGAGFSRNRPDPQAAEQYQ